MVKMSNLPPDSLPTGTDYIIVYDAETGATKKVLLSDLFSQGLIGTSGVADDAITSPKLVGVDKANLTEDSNPYKFHAYRSANYTHSSGALIQLNAEVFDTNSNFDVATYKYTVPVSGFYQINAGVLYSISSNASTGYDVQVRKNGAGLIVGLRHVNMYTGSYSVSAVAGGLVQLTAGDLIDIVGASAATNTINASANQTFLSGFLVSRT